MLHEQNEHQRILIHDTKNHLQSISALSKQNCPEKVNEYIRELLSSSSLQESRHMCNYPLLNSILERYRQQCEEQQILFDADIRAHTLDNAFKAARTVPDG